MSSSAGPNFVEIAIAVGVLVVIGLLYYAITKSTTSLGDVQSQLGAINEQISKNATNIQTIINNIETMQKGQASLAATVAIMQQNQGTMATTLSILQSSQSSIQGTQSNLGKAIATLQQSVQQNQDVLNQGITSIQSGQSTAAQTFAKMLDAQASASSLLSTIQQDQDVLSQNLSSVQQTQTNTGASLESILSGQSTLSTNINALLNGQTAAKTDLASILSGQTAAKTDLASILSGQTAAKTDLASILSGQTAANADMASILNGQISANTDLASILSRQTSANTDLASILSGQTTMKRSLTSIMNDQIDLVNSSSAINNSMREYYSELSGRHNLLKAALDEFISKSISYYDSNQASIKSINDIISSLNTYVTDKLFIKDDFNNLVGLVNSKLKASTGSMTNRGTFSANDTADQIVESINLVKSQIMTNTIDYMKTSNEFTDIIKTQMIKNMDTVEIRNKMAGVINALLVDRKIIVATDQITDFFPVVNKLLSTNAENLKSSNISDFQTAVMNTVQALLDADKIVIQTNDIARFKEQVNALITASDTQTGLAQVQGDMSSLRLTLGNYINALNTNKLALTDSDLAKMYTLLPNNRTQLGNNLYNQCGTYADLFSAYSACNLNSSCVGFTAVTIPNGDGTTMKVPACLKTYIDNYALSTVDPSKSFTESGFTIRGQQYQTYMKKSLADYVRADGVDIYTPKNLKCYDWSTSTSPDINVQIMDAVAECNATIDCAGFSAKKDSNGQWKPVCLKSSLYYDKRDANTAGLQFYVKDPAQIATVIPNKDGLAANELIGVIPGVNASCSNSQYPDMVKNVSPAMANFWCSVHPLCRGFSVKNNRPACFYYNTDTANQVTREGTNLYTMPLNEAGQNNTYNQITYSSVSGIDMRPRMPAGRNPFANILLPGQSLAQDQYIFSSDNRFMFGIPNDNSKKYGIAQYNVRWIWVSKEYPVGGLLMFTRNGNLEFQTAAAATATAPTVSYSISNTTGKNAAYLIMQCDGNVVIYNNKNKPIWSLGPNKYPFDVFSGISANLRDINSTRAIPTKYSGYIVYENATNNTTYYLHYNPFKRYAMGGLLRYPTWPCSSSSMKRLGNMVVWTTDPNLATIFTYYPENGGIEYGPGGSEIWLDDMGNNVSSTTYTNIVNLATTIDSLRNTVATTTGIAQSVATTSLNTTIALYNTAVTTISLTAYYMVPNKLSNLNQNQTYTIDPYNQKIQTITTSTTKPILNFDPNGYAWEYMGTYQYETEFPSTKSIAYYATTAVNSSFWKSNSANYIAICKDKNNTTNGWIYTWNDEPKLQTKIADSTVGCNDNSSIICGSGDATSKTWAVYKKVLVPVPNPTPTQAVRFELLDPLNSIKIGQSIRCLNPTTNLSTFTKLGVNNYWDTNGPGMYTCPSAPGVRTDLPDWCIFNTEDDVRNWCSSDINCVGFVSETRSTGGTIYQALNRPAVPNSTRSNSSYFVNDTYRYKGNNTISKYTNPHAAYTWDPNYNSPMQLYCDTINLTKDTDIGHNYPIGMSLQCGATAPPTTTATTTFRYDSPNTIRPYTNSTIAASWDPKWGEYTTIDCNGMTLGPNMVAK
jgi:hypothetical protein